MKDKTRLAGLMGCLALVVLLRPTAIAQPIPDLSTPTNITGSCNTLCTITGGIQADRNLFHSFEEFSIPTRGGVRFDNAAAIANIFSRVTGNSPSNIDGLLRANGIANVFLLNPNGVLFGPNARLNIGGSFMATTADSILFDNGLEFSAGDRQPPSLLTVSVPIGLQYGSPTAGIAVDGSTLRVNAGESLILAGGAITLDQGRLFSGSGTIFNNNLFYQLRLNGGRIELASLAEAGVVDLETRDDQLRLNIPEALTRTNISLTNESLIDVVANNGGEIIINAQNFELLQGSQLRAGTIAGNPEDQARDIEIRATGQVSVSGRGIRSFNRGGSAIFNSVESGEGAGGAINITAEVLSVTNRGDVSTRTFADGNAGAIDITANVLSVTDGGAISTQTFAEGNAGDITINAIDYVEVMGGPNLFPSSIDSDAGRNAEGDAGDVWIQTRYLVARYGGQIGSGTFGFGNAGDLTIIATEGVDVIGRSPASVFFESPGDDGSLPSLLSTQVQRDSEGGDGGNIRIETNDLSISGGAAVSARSFGTGQSDSGTITVIAPGSVEIDGVYEFESEIGPQTRRSGLFTQVGRRETEDIIEGDAERINIETGRLIIRNGGSLNSRNSGPGQAGEITVVADSIELSGQSRLFELGSEFTAESIGTGDAGNLILDTASLTIQDGGRIRASTISGRGGNVSLPNLRTLQVTDGEISAATETGQAGNLTINVFERIKLADNARLLVEATDDQGRSGSLFITSDELLLQNGSRISASNTSGRSADIMIQGLSRLVVDNSEISASTQTGRAGNLMIASDIIRLNNEGRFSVATTAGGTAGGLSLDAQQLMLRDGASISLNSTETGRSGNLDVNAENVVLTNRSRLTANTESGSGGSVELYISNTLRLRNGSQISALTQNGLGGQLTLNRGQDPANRVEISSNSSISTEAIGTGDAGNLALNMRQLTVEDGGEIAATTRSGVAGGIVLRGLEQLEVMNGRVSASTQTGQAGSLRIRAIDSVELNGEGGLLVQADETGGIAGDLSIRTGRFIVQDGAETTVSSPQGQAGNLNVTANQIRLDRGFLTAETGLSQTDRGAEINLQGLERLVMGDESQISATAFADANGGNVTIDAAAGFVIAVSNQDSDIIARAFAGRGGNIQIAAQGIFSLEERPAIPGNGTNDIDASSNFGLAGTVVLNRLNTDPSRGLAELPGEVVDAADQIAQTCLTGGNVAATQGEFIVTGRGGLPPSPDEIHSGDESYVDLVVTSFDDDDDSLLGSASSYVPDVSPPQIVEAQGWDIDDDGEVILVATMSTMPQQSRSDCIR